MSHSLMIRVVAACVVLTASLHATIETPQSQARQTQRAMLDVAVQRTPTFQSEPPQPPQADRSTFVSAPVKLAAPSQQLVEARIAIDRVFTQKTDLRDAVASGVLPPSAELTVALYGFANGLAACGGAVAVLVNGQHVTRADGTLVELRATNSGWLQQTVAVPTAWLHMPTTVDENEADGVDHPPAAALNTISIQPRAQTCQTPSTMARLGWAALTIRTAVMPIVFVHGWAGNETKFADFYRFAQRDGVPAAKPRNFHDGLDPIPIMAQLVIREVERVRTIFGVDKVAIFAHSKGGLVARVAQGVDPGFVQHVGAIFTFGAPHHGTKLIIGAALKNCGLPTNQPFYSQCWESATELFQASVRDTVNFYGCTPALSIAGIELGGYADCAPRSEYWNYPQIQYRSFASPMAVGDVGASATMPWRSEQWVQLDQPEPGIFDMQGVDEVFDVDHSGIRSDPAVYACAISYIEPRIGDGSTCPSQQVRAAQARQRSSKLRNLALLSMAATSTLPAHERTLQTIVENSTALGANVAHTTMASINDSKRAIFTVRAATSITFTLVDPAGRTITPTSQDAHYSAQQDDETGAWQQYQIEYPAAGTWQLVAQSPVDTVVTLSAQADAPALLSVGVGSTSYQPNQNIPVVAALSEHGEKLDAVITATAIDTLGNKRIVSLVDDGKHGDTQANDRLYTAMLNSGAVNGVVTIEIQAQRGTTQRSMRSCVMVRAQTGVIVGAVTTPQQAADEPDVLAASRPRSLSVAVKVRTNGGMMAVQGVLEDSKGNFVAAASFNARLRGTPLAAGAQTIALVFDGDMIARSRRTGPFHLARVSLIDQNQGSAEVDQQVFDAPEHAGVAAALQFQVHSPAATQLYTLRSTELLLQQVDSTP